MDDPIELVGAHGPQPVAAKETQQEMDSATSPLNKARSRMQIAAILLALAVRISDLLQTSATDQSPHSSRCSLLP